MNKLFLKKVSGKRLLKVEFLDFVIDEIHDVKKSQIKELEVMLKDIQKLLDAYALTFNEKTKRKSLTGLRGKTNRLLHRDVLKRFRSLMVCYDGICSRERAEEAEAVRTLSDLLDHHRHAMLRAGYRKTIRTVYLLLEGLEEPNRKAAINALKLDDVVAKLREANLALDTAFDNSLVTPKAKLSAKEIAAMGVRIHEDYQRVMSIVKWALNEHPTDAIKDFVLRHNTRVENLEIMQRIRTSHSMENLKKQAKQLTDIALSLGWKLPAGKECFEMKGRTLLLNPIDKRWYKFLKKRGKYEALAVEANEKNPVSRKPSRPNSNGALNLSDVNKVDEAHSASNEPHKLENDHPNTEAKPSPSANASGEKPETAEPSNMAPVGGDAERDPKTGDGTGF